MVQASPLSPILDGHVNGVTGHLLAVACTDNHIRLISAFSGKTVHHLPTQPLLQSSRISCFGWGINFTNSTATQEHLKDTGGQVSLDDLLSLNAQISTLLKTKADLPRELALIDIETSLPKLSTLPPISGE